MNVRLKKTLEFYCGVVYQEQFLVNYYGFDISMITTTISSEEQNIAYDRMKFFIDHVLDNSILICESNPLLETYQKTGARLIVLPEEPVDQVVGMMLYLKLNSIMENRMVVTDVELWSRVGDSISYLHSGGESLGLLAQGGWWSDARPCWYLPQEKTTPGKIVSLDRMPEWKDCDLDWDDASNDQENSVVFAKFGQNENE